VLVMCGRLLLNNSDRNVDGLWQRDGLGPMAGEARRTVKLDERGRDLSRGLRALLMLLLLLLLLLLLPG
jgi:hypothetical protein